MKNVSTLFFVIHTERGAHTTHHWARSRAILQLRYIIQFRFHFQSRNQFFFSLSARHNFSLALARFYFRLLLLSSLLFSASRLLFSLRSLSECQHKLSLIIFKINIGNHLIMCHQAPNASRYPKKWKIRRTIGETKWTRNSLIFADDDWVE